MYRRLALLALGLVLVGGSSLVAQDAVLGQIYGAGVHAYFAGDFSQAHEDLTAAITGGSQDPRCHYFRGLCYLELGREEEAKMDFETGAELETKDVNKYFNVPSALERIQGEKRMLLETFRAEGRMIALEKERKLRAERYEAFQVEQTRVLEERIEAAPPLPDDVEPPAAIDPFGVETEPAEPGDTEPAEPFGEETMEPAETTEPADPFGAETVEPADPFGAESPGAAEPAASVPRDVEPAKVLGALGGLLENAFGGGDSEEEFDFGGMGDNSFGEDPFGELTEEMEEPMIDEGADPFGVEEDAPSMEDVAPPVADPLGAEPEPAPAAEPFGAEPGPAPAAEPAADPFSNPFGE